MWQGRSSCDIDCYEHLDKFKNLELGTCRVVAQQSTYFDRIQPITNSHCATIGNKNVQKTQETNLILTLTITIDEQLL